MIQEFMNDHNISQYKLAKLLRTTPTTISRWKHRGHPNPRILKLALDQLDLKLEFASKQR